MLDILSWARPALPPSSTKQVNDWNKQNETTHHSSVDAESFQVPHIRNLLTM